MDGTGSQSLNRALLTNALDALSFELEFVEENLTLFDGPFDAEEPEWADPPALAWARLCERIRALKAEVPPNIEGIRCDTLTRDYLRDVRAALTQFEEHFAIDEPASFRFAARYGLGQWATSLRNRVTRLLWHLAPDDPVRQGAIILEGQASLPIAPATSEVRNKGGRPSEWARLKEIIRETCPDLRLSEDDVKTIKAEYGKRWVNKPRNEGSGKTWPPADDKQICAVAKEMRRPRKRTSAESVSEATG